MLYLAVEFLPVSLSETVVFLPGNVPVLEEGGQLGGGEEGGAAAVGDCCVHVYLICASRCSSGGGGRGDSLYFLGGYCVHVYSLLMRRGACIIRALDK